MTGKIQEDGEENFQYWTSGSYLGRSRKRKAAKGSERSDKHEVIKNWKARRILGKEENVW